MGTKFKEKFLKDPDTRTLITLLLVLTLICVSIFLLRAGRREERTFQDTLAGVIRQEMTDDRIVLEQKGLRRTVAEFQEPILLTCSKESRLIVHSAQLSEIISIASEGLGGWAWTSAYQDIQYTGQAQYTVDLSRLTEEDFAVNNELKTLTVRIPYAVLDPINIPAEQIRFRDVKKGWAAPKDIKLTAEENARLQVQVADKMKAKLIDENVIRDANENAKIVVTELLSATVRSIDPEYTVVVVQ